MSFWGDEKVVQVTATTSGADNELVLFALRADGSIWMRKPLEPVSEWMEVPAIPDSSI